MRLIAASCGGVYYSEGTTRVNESMAGNGHIIANESDICGNEFQIVARATSMHKMFKKKNEQEGEQGKKCARAVCVSPGSVTK